MAKVLLDVILVEGTDKQGFVDSFNAETEADWWNMLGSMPNLLVMNVEEDYVETFRSHSNVIQATEIPEDFEASTAPSVEEMTKWYTSSTSSSHRNPSGNGEDNAPVQFLYDSNQLIPLDGGGEVFSVGRDDDSFSTGGPYTYKSRWTGKHVDIVTLESGSGGDWASNAGTHDTHPDYQKLSSEDDSHERADPYWYQCQYHANMKNTITVNAADGTRNTYTFTVSFGGSGIYTLVGNDRNGSINGSNPPITIQEGDILIFNVTASGHPFLIRDADGGSNISDGSVDNAGAENGTVTWTTRTSSRFIPMDWPDLEADANNQITTNSGGNSGLTNHGMGVLSAAGGSICGFAKKANLYAMYLVTGDSPTECIQSLIDWHNAKPNNSETGVPNPTIMIAEYQYLTDRKHGIPIESVSQINKADGTTVSRPGGASSANSPYWYQCQYHANMKNTITVGTSDGTSNNYNINVSFGGSGLYAMSGTDRNGTVNGNNPPINIKDGDTITFNVNAEGHPFLIRDADGGNNINDGSVTGQGAELSNVGFTTNVGGWGTDFSEFVKENIIPFKVYDPTSVSYSWMVVMPTQFEYSSLKTALDSAWNNGIVCINAAGNNGGTFNKQNSQSDTSIDIDTGPNYPIININYASSNTNSTSSASTWYPFKSYGPHGVESNIDVAAGYNSEDYPGLDGYSNRGPGIDIVGLGANTWTSYPGTTYGTYKWGMFSGTSCATPTVVGKAALVMEEYFWYNDAWPTPDQTKSILLSKASNKCRGMASGGVGFSWSNVPSAGGASLSNEISFGNCIISSGNSANGGFTYTELTGTTHLRAYFDPQDQDSHPFEHRIKHQSKRPVAGGTYPRVNSVVGRHRMDLPDMT